MRTFPKRSGLLLLITGILLFAGLQVGAQQKTAESHNTESPTLAEAAQSAYESAASEYAAMRLDDVDLLYRWSKRWMEAEDSPAARQSHLERMQGLHNRVAALHKSGIRGGDTRQYHATIYYVAEARAKLSGP